MSEFEDLMSAGLSETEAKLPKTLVDGPREYPCIFSELTLDDVVTGGGFIPNADALAIVRKEVLETAFVKGHNITVDGRRFKVAKCEGDAGSWDVYLEAPAKR